jgi:cytosine/adenosine deaminase-related metal-dependent hydrolase
LQTLNRHRSAGKYSLTTKKLVQMATIGGAIDLGLADRTGSLTPGKRADLILVRTTDSNMSPVGDPYDALVQLAMPSNVDTVVVDGRILRQKSQFTVLDHEKVTRDASDALAGLIARAKWPA